MLTHAVAHPAARSINSMHDVTADALVLKLFLSPARSSQLMRAYETCEFTKTRQ